MFHISNLGSYGVELEHYADEDCYVPEASDRATVPDRHHEGWHAGDGIGTPACDDPDVCGCADEWRAHVDSAIKLTKEAEKAISERNTRA